MPDPDRLLRTLKQAALAFRDTPGRRGRVVELQDAQEILATGDLHGNLDNFKRILDLAQLARHPGRHLVLQEVVHGPGRYANGGDQSHRLLDLVAALKCQFPRQVHMLLGNHELSQWTGRAIIKAEEDLNQLFRLGIEAAYGGRAAEVDQAYGELIHAIPVALCAPNRVFLSHSLPSAAKLQDWRLADLYGETHGEEDWKPGGCIHSVVWGRDLAAENLARYLDQVAADFLITGHIPCPDGFMVPNPRHLILDCKDDQAHVCLFSTAAPADPAELVRSVKPLRPRAEAAL